MKRAHQIGGLSVQPAARPRDLTSYTRRIACLAANFKVAGVSVIDLDLDIRLIQDGDRLRGMSLGDEAFVPLKTFIQKRALEFEKQSLARTYAAFRVEPRKLLGYVTVVCGEVVTEDGDECLIEGVEYHYKHYPAVKIARLAVDQSVQGSGLGKHLVDLALGIAKREVSKSVGCRFVVVDSKKNAVKFYEKCGFTMLDTEANKERSAPVMFVDLSKIVLEEA